MAHVAVDEDGEEAIFESGPVPAATSNGRYWASQMGDDVVYLPKGSVEKLLGRKLTWEDGPVKLKG